MTLSAFGQLVARRAARPVEPTRVLKAKVRVPAPRARQDTPTDSGIDAPIEEKAMSTRDRNTVAGIARRERVAAQAAASPTLADEGRAFAAKMARVTATVRGEKFDPDVLDADVPDQTRVHVTGDDMVRALKASGRAAKPGEYL